MAGASFILAINLFIAALFALAFFLVAATNRSDGTPRWFALAYCCGLLYIGSEFILPVQVNPQLTYTAGFAAFLGALGCATIGIAARYRLPVPWLLLAVITGLSIAANWLAFDLGRDSLVRLFAYQAPYALLQALAAWLVWRSRRRQPMDVGLMVLFCLSAVQFLSKPLVAQWTGGVGDFAQSYIATTYALYSQSLGAILQVAVGLLILLMLVRDMLVEITSAPRPIRSPRCSIAVASRTALSPRSLPRVKPARPSRWWRATSTASSRSMTALVTKRAIR